MQWVRLGIAVSSLIAALSMMFLGFGAEAPQPRSGATPETAGATAAGAEVPGGATGPAAPGQAEPAVVYHMVIKDAIQVVTAEYAVRAMDKADADRADLLVFQLETPGGMMDSMEEIIQKILSCRTLVAVWVAPSGARAASAGFYILLASDVAIMAPGTRTGSAHPIMSGLGGSQDDKNKQSEILLEKVTHDAAASLRSIVERRGRNVEMAEKAVRESVSYTETEALKGGIIDLVCPDLHSVLNSLDGKTFKKFDGTPVTLRTAEARVVEVNMTMREKLLTTIANPTLAYLLLMIGLIGLYVEFTHPGFVLPGVAGGICLLVAFFALKILPFNWVGLLLIAAALGMFIAEVKVHSYGLLTVGGIVALVLGSIILINGPIPELRVPLGVIIPIAVAVGIIVTFLLSLVVASARLKPTTGREGLIGQEGSAVTDINPEGRVFLLGEYWNAKSERAITKGEKIQVVKIENLCLTVEPRAEKT